MVAINPKKLKAIKNKSIPNPLRPRFRNKEKTNIYFLSQRKVQGEKRDQFIQNFKMIVIISILLIGGYFLSN
jgi:hypothetical protein